VEDALAAFGLVFLAELGDKSMLLAVALASRYRPWPVLGGIAIAAFSMLGAATLAGAAIGTALPERPLAIGAGLLFLGFGVWTLRDDGDGVDRTTLRSGSVLVGVTIAFLVAEFGDKTMLATATLATTRGPVPTWLGASLGMTAASGVAIAIVTALGTRLPDRVVRVAAAVAFLAVGAWLLLDGLRG
jgi:Ca2+/H+ antiporter, TMEM165/GDT1 family